MSNMSLPLSRKFLQKRTTSKTSNSKLSNPNVVPRAPRINAVLFSSFSLFALGGLVEGSLVFSGDFEVVEIVAFVGGKETVGSLEAVYWLETFLAKLESVTCVTEAVYIAGDDGTSYDDDDMVFGITAEDEEGEERASVGNGNVEVGEAEGDKVTF